MEVARQKEEAYEALVKLHREDESNVMTYLRKSELESDSTIQNENVKVEKPLSPFEERGADHVANPIYGLDSDLTPNSPLEDSRTEASASANPASWQMGLWSRVRDRALVGEKNEIHEIHRAGTSQQIAVSLPELESSRGQQDRGVVMASVIPLLCVLRMRCVMKKQTETRLVFQEMKSLFWDELLIEREEAILEQYQAVQELGTRYKSLREGQVELFRSVDRGHRVRIGDCAADTARRRVLNRVLYKVKCELVSSEATIRVFRAWCRGVGEWREMEESLMRSHSILESQNLLINSSQKLLESRLERRIDATEELLEVQSKETREVNSLSKKAAENALRMLARIEARFDSLENGSIRRIDSIDNKNGKANRATSVLEQQTPTFKPGTTKEESHPRAKFEVAQGAMLKIEEKLLVLEDKVSTKEEKASSQNVTGRGSTNKSDGSGRREREILDQIKEIVHRDGNTVATSEDISRSNKENKKENTQHERESTTMDKVSDAREPGGRDEEAVVPGISGEDALHHALHVSYRGYPPLSNRDAAEIPYDGVANGDRITPNQPQTRVEETIGSLSTGAAMDIGDLETDAGASRVEDGGMDRLLSKPLDSDQSKNGMEEMSDIEIDSPRSKEKGAILGQKIRAKRKEAEARAKARASGAKIRAKREAKQNVEEREGRMKEKRPLEVSVEVSKNAEEETVWSPENPVSYRLPDKDADDDDDDDDDDGSSSNRGMVGMNRFVDGPEMGTAKAERIKAELIAKEATREGRHWMEGIGSELEIKSTGHDALSNQDTDGSNVVDKAAMQHMSTELAETGEGLTGRPGASEWKQVGAHEEYEEHPTVWNPRVIHGLHDLNERHQPQALGSLGAADTDIIDSASEKTVELSRMAADEFQVEAAGYDGRDDVKDEAKDEGMGGMRRESETREGGMSQGKEHHLTWNPRVTHGLHELNERHQVPKGLESGGHGHRKGMNKAVLAQKETFKQKMKESKEQMRSEARSLSMKIDQSLEGLSSEEINKSLEGLSSEEKKAIVEGPISVAKTAGHAAGAEAMMDGLSPEEVSDAAAKAALEGGAPRSLAAEVAGQMAGATVVNGGGTSEEASAAAAMGVRRHGGSLRAQANAAKKAVELDMDMSPEKRAHTLESDRPDSNPNPK